jgi:outer membrane biosynthesis protein TonB
MNRLTVTAWLLALALSACAQQEAPKPPVASTPKPTPEKVYTFVEQMPQLPGGGGQQAIGNEVLKRFKLLPGRVEPSCYRVVAYFEVSPTGLIQHVRIIRASQSAVVDSSLLAAIRSLPTLNPGYQQGQPVTVSLTMPCNIATQ